MNDERSLMAGINALRMGYTKKSTPNPDQIIYPPWTRRDIGDMLMIRDGIDWLLSEIKMGCMLAEERHGWTIRNIDAVNTALERKERDFVAKAGFNPNQPRVPAGSSDGGQWTGTGAGGSSTTVGRGRDKVPLPNDNGSQDTTDKRPLSARVPRPEYRPGISPVSHDDWRTIQNTITSKPSMSSAKSEAYKNIWAAEGGLKKDPEGTAVAGIPQATLDKAKANPKFSEKLKDIKYQTILKSIRSVCLIFMTHISIRN